MEGIENIIMSLLADGYNVCNHQCDVNVKLRKSFGSLELSIYIAKHDCVVVDLHDRKEFTSYIKNYTITNIRDMRAVMKALLHYADKLSSMNATLKKDIEQNTELPF